MRYKAFISYSHRDEARAARLHRRLESYRAPRGLTLPDGSKPERLYPVYRDREEMAASHSLTETIEAALAASDHLIVLCSPSSAASAWVNDEVRLFAALNGADRILPVIVDGHPPACFPPALLGQQAEPLAPDMRDGKDGFDDGALKIVAGLWGVSLGVLKDRDAARRRRRARLQAGLAAVVAALAVFAGFSEWRAAEQKARAEAEARLAEARSLASVARVTLDQNPGETSVAAMIAAQSLAFAPTADARQVLRDALKLAPLGAEAAPFPWRWPRVAVSGDGRIAAFMSAPSSEGAPARSAIARLTPDLSERGRIAFDGLARPVLSPDGAILAVGGPVRRLLALDLATGATVLDQPVDSGLDVAFSSDGATLYAATQLGEVLRWRVGAAGAEALRQTPASGARLSMPVLGVSPSDGWLLRAESGHPGVVTPLDGGAVREIPFTRRYETLGWRAQEPDGALAHPDGGHFIAWDSYNTGALYSAETMTAVWSFDDRSRASTWQAANVISGDGAFYARARSDGDISVRDMSGGAVVLRADHGGAVRGAAFLDRPRRLVAAGEGGASIWRIGEEAPPTRCAADADILSLAVDAGGTILLGAADGRLIRCDPATGATLAQRDFDAPVATIAAAPDDIVVALQLSDRKDSWTEVAFVDRETGAARRLSLNEPFDQIMLSHDGARAAMRSWATGEVAIRDAATGDLISRFAARGDLAGFSPLGDRLLMDHAALNVFDVATGQRLMQFGDAAGVSSLSADPHVDLLITEGEVDDAREQWGWSAENGARLWRIRGDVTMAAGGAAFAARLAEDARWRVTDRATGAEIGAVPDEGGVWRAVLSRDGGRIAITRRLTAEDGAGGYEAALWDVRASRRVWRKRMGASGAPPPLVIDLSPDRAALVAARRAADGSLAGEIEVFDWSSGKTVFSAPWPAVGPPVIAVDRAAARVALSTSLGTRLYRLSDGARLWSAPQGHGGGLAFSPDGATLVGARPVGRDRTVITALASDTGATLGAWTADLTLMALAVTSDSRRVVAAFDSDGWSGLKTWRLADGAPALEVEMDAGPRQLHPLADPYRVIVRDAAGAVRAFDLTTGAETRRFPMAARADLVAFGAAGGRAVTAAGARLRHWNVGTGEEIATIAAAGRVAALAIRPDGAEIAFVTRRKRQAGGGETSLVQIWRPGAAASVEALAADAPSRLAYDPTGETLLIASHKGILRGVDARTLSPRFTLRPLANGAFETSASGAPLFTGDGRHLVVRETGSYGQGNTTERRAALRVFDAVTGAEAARFDASFFTGGLAATANGFFYADVSGRQRHYQIGAASMDLRLDDASADKVLAAPGGDLILVSGYWRAAALIDSRTGARIELMAKDDKRRTLDSAIDRAGRHVVLSLFAEEAGEAAYEMMVFDAKTGEALARTGLSPLAFRNIEFAGDGDMIIAAEQPENALITSASDRGALYKWRWRDGAPAPFLADNPVADFEVSADGAWLLTSEGGKSRDTDARFGVMQTRLIRLSDGEARLTRPHDLYGPRLVLDAEGDRLGVFSAASPTSGDIVDVGADGRVERRLNIAPEDVAFFGEPLGFPDGGDRFVLGERSGARVYSLADGATRRLRTPWRARSYALSPDGALLAIGGEATVSVWDLATSERLADLKVEDLHSLTFAGGDGRSLIAVTRGGVFRVEWDLGTLVETACDVYRHDRWDSGRRRIVADDAPGLCADPEQAAMRGRRSGP